jgi:hypothetical protein
MYYTLTPEEQEGLEKLAKVFDIEKQNALLSTVEAQR